MPNEKASIISKSSSYIANILKHIWLAEVSKCLWRKDPHLNLGIFASEVDNSGVDVVLSLNNMLTRHIQLKSSYSGATTDSVTVNSGLAAMESGCVVWVLYNIHTLEIERYLFFGAGPEEPLPSISAYKIGKRVFPNSSGSRPERPRTRTLPKSAFRKMQSIDELVNALFGV